MRYLFFLAMLVLFCASNAGADCKTDCLKDYNTAIRECKATYNDPNDPKCAEKCQECLDQAKSDYDSCLDQCKDEWDTHED